MTPTATKYTLRYTGGEYLYVAKTIVVETETHEIQSAWSNVLRARALALSIYKRARLAGRLHPSVLSGVATPGPTRA